MADDPEEREVATDDDPFTEFDEWAGEADERAWASL
jgi:hypothetical protein